MNQEERKRFWDVLSTMHDAIPEHIQQLQQAITVPHTLCRFRAVNENSLTQLQENKLYFSTADYYDDPFDTFFHINYDAIEQQLEAIKVLLNNPASRELAIKQISSLGIAEKIISDNIESAAQSSLSIESFHAMVEKLHNQILKSLYSICFCENPLNETLWLKYAENHKGFVITYDFQNTETYLCGKETVCKNCTVSQYSPSLYPVYYSDSRYDASRYALAMLLKAEMASGNIKIPQSLLTAIDSSVLWEIERISLIKKYCHHFDGEWRMLYPRWSGQRPCIKLKPKSVIIGLRTPTYKERLIVSAATIAGITDIRKVQINRNDELEAVPLFQ